MFQMLHSITLLRESVTIRSGPLILKLFNLRREALPHLEWDHISGMEVTLTLEWCLITT